ncbi:serine/arginine repetitive matrix protein 2 isoform X4 [Rhipicephalus sanguineus]|uniref:serine/arginine repetitive matrix protein 2 isoform X4 n=1 Tax=Rhipicephalus sanguineus TaxID=34632 RepID=UPI0018931474|nr:serine/arginine repetitive matrix protein 2 isoform X4 [Rhipicephalus sanguineus]
MVKFFSKFHLPSFRSLGMDHRSDSKWVLTSKDGTVHPLPAGMIFIGRQECDIIVDSASVDKRHAVIFFNPSDKCFHVKDLNSVTGTYLNGVRIPEQSYVKLNHLDSLRFGYGHEVFCVHKTTDRAVPLDSASPKRNTPAFGDGDLVIREDSSANRTLSRDSPASESSDKMLHSSNGAHSAAFLRESPSQDAQSQLGSPARSTHSAEDVIPHRMKLSSPSSSRSPEAQPPSSTGCSRHPSPPLTSTSKETSPLASRPHSTVASPPISSPPTPAAATTSSPVGSDPASPEKASSSSPSSAEKEASLSSPVMQDADSLEDLSRTEDSLSTVREVLPPVRPPPTKPTTLSWKPLHSPSKPHAPPPPTRPEEKGDDESSPGGCGTKSTASKDEQSPCPDTPASQTQASGSTAMAFTIHFDNDATGGRPLALKDSIRKFAPPKPESERTPSKSRASPVSKPGEPSSTVSAGGRRTPTSPTNASDLAKRRWSGAEVRNRSGGGGGWSSDVEPSRQGRRQDDQRLSDSASYLIQRMLNDGPARAPLPGPIKSASSAAARIEPSSGLEQVLSPADDRSETGTYTVETDRMDPDVEEARRRIDEVFGVSSYNHPSSAEQYQRVRPEGEGVSGSRPRSQVSGGSIDLNRTKRRLPTPPLERAPLDIFVPSTESSSATVSAARKSAPTALQAPAACANATARKRLGSTGSRPSPPCSPPRTHRTTFTKTPSNKVMSTSFGDGTFLRQTPAASSSAQRRSAPPQRKSWGLTGSEADLAAGSDLACGSEETASVVSDTSTEPSSHSSGSRGGPQMKLNRAFALRRARLGLPEVGGLPPATAAPPRGKTPHHGSNPNLSRQDGGRFSLRLPRGVRATDVGVTRAELLRGKAHHQRTDSDPTAAYRSQQHSVSDGESRHHSPRVQRKQPAGKSYISDGDDDARTGSPVQFGRSASFGGHRDLALTPAASDRQHRGRSAAVPTTGSSLSRGETFLKGGAGASGTTFVRSGRKPERQSGDGESKTPTENGVKTPSTTPGRRELSALDSLVISAIHQLSGKLRTSARTLIEKERLKYPENSDVRLMLEEVLPRVVERRPSDSPTDGNLTRELSSILKNLKRIEQSLEVLNSLAPCERDGSSDVVPETTTKTAPAAQKPRGGFFYVDV